MMSAKNIADVSTFWLNYDLYCNQHCGRPIQDFVDLFSLNERWKIILYKITKIPDHSSGKRRPEPEQMTKNPEKNDDVIIFRHDVIVEFFWRQHISFIKLH